MILAHSRNTTNPTLFPTSAQALRLWDNGSTNIGLVNTASGVYNWSGLNTHLSAAEAAGLKSIYTMGNTPPWAAVPVAGAVTGIKGPSSNFPMTFAAWGAFIDALLAQFGNRLWAIEAWNEWNSNVFWAGCLDQLATRQEILYRKVKKATPNLLVTTPTPCLANSGPWPTADVALDAFFATGAPFDVVTFHGYVNPGAPGPQVKSTIQAIRAVMAKYGVTVPLWDTEFGPGAASAFATTDAQRLWVLDSYIARKQAGLDLACYYQWDNQTHGAMVDMSGNPTPFGQAWSDFVSMLL